MAPTLQRDPHLARIWLRPCLLIRAHCCWRRCLLLPPPPLPPLLLLLLLLLRLLPLHGAR
jgi:hypothetical protein